LKMFEKLAQELCYDVGYRCEEWITIEDSTVRFATFAAFDRPHIKIVLLLESTKSTHRCDLLFPVAETSLASCMVSG